MIALFFKIRDIFDKRQRRGMVFLLFLILLSSVMELLGVSAILPLVESVITPEVLETNKTYKMIMEMIGASSPRAFIMMMSIILAFVYVMKNVFLIWMKHKELEYLCLNRKKIAVNLMDCYIHQEYNFHVNTNVAELERNVSSDVVNFFEVVQKMLDLITEMMVCTLLIIFLAITDFWMTVIMGLLLGVLLGGLVITLKGRLRKLGERTRDVAVLRTKWFLQSFQGIKEIKAGHKEESFRGKYEQTYEEYARMTIQQSLINYIPKPIAEMLCISGVLLFLAVRVMLGNDLSRFVSVLSVFAIAAFRMLPSFNRISGDLTQIMFNKPSVDALHDDLEQMNALNEIRSKGLEGTKKKVLIREAIDIDHITFAYSSKPDVVVLNDVSLKIPARKSIAFVGPSGAGKTTLADIILGIYTPDAGSILADGKDIREEMDAWHRSIGYIPQTIYLIDDTIRANIAFGIPEKEIDDAKVWDALEQAKLADFVREQPEGLDSNIGESGVKLSGGQRQRIGIARALYGDPELLIMDEATSALDNETESAVMDAIYHLSGKVTMIVIAHRLTTIKNCDEIYRIQSGKAAKITYEEANGQ